MVKKFIYSPTRNETLLPDAVKIEKQGTKGKATDFFGKRKRNY